MHSLLSYCQAPDKKQPCCNIFIFHVRIHPCLSDRNSEFSIASCVGGSTYVLAPALLPPHGSKKQEIDFSFHSRAVMPRAHASSVNTFHLGAIFLYPSLQD